MRIVDYLTRTARGLVPASLLTPQTDGRHRRLAHEHHLHRDEELERADRRAFLRGLAVTSAGLLVARPTIFLPPKPKVETFDWRLVGVDYKDWDWSANGGEKYGGVAGIIQAVRDGEVWAELRL